MSTYYSTYQTYLASYYHSITILAFGSLCLVLGWVLIGWLVREGPVRRVTEWAYLAACASIYLSMIVYSGAK
jgi:hypothetical protein